MEDMNVRETRREGERVGIDGQGNRKKNGKAN